MYECVCERVWARLVLSHTHWRTSLVVSELWACTFLMAQQSCCVQSHAPRGSRNPSWEKEWVSLQNTPEQFCFFLSFFFCCFGCVVVYRVCFTPARKITFFPPVLNVKPPFCCLHLLPLSDIPTRLFVSIVPSGPPFFYIFNLLFLFFCICSICHLAANPFLDVSLSLASSPAAWMALWLLPTR